jgi:3-methyl-2-oxobutanoate hydroxymethyltransferase
VLGTNRGHMPRHSKKYVDLSKEYDRIQEMRIGAFKSFVKDVQKGSYPSAPYLVTAPKAEMAEFRKKMRAK